MKKNARMAGRFRRMLALAIAVAALVLVIGHEYLFAFEGVVTRTEDDYERAGSGSADTVYRVFYRKADGAETSARVEYPLYLRAKPGMVLRKKRWTLKPEVFDVPAGTHQR
jgi:hypothetical protein